jgi:hypothetical protein
MELEERFISDRPILFAKALEQHGSPLGIAGIFHDFTDVPQIHISCILLKKHRVECSSPGASEIRLQPE